MRGRGFMHEEGSTPRPANSGWRDAAKQLWHRYWLFIIWLFLSMAISFYCFYKFGTIDGEAGLLLFLWLSIITFPTLFVFAFALAYLCVFLFEILALDSTIWDVTGSFFTLLLYLSAGYLQWGYLVPKILRDFHGWKQKLLLGILFIFYLLAAIFFVYNGV